MNPEYSAFTANLAEQRARAARRAGVPSTSHWQWYISIRAIRDYLQIMGYPAPAGEISEDDPYFQRAEQELGAYSITAKLTPRTLKSGAVIYRSGKLSIRGRGGRRLEFVVVETPRAEGLLPQLVKVGTK
jgi:hypothetical protein